MSSMSPIVQAPVGAVSNAFAAKSVPIVKLDQLCRSGAIPAINAFYALLVYGLYCHKTKKGDRLTLEPFWKIMDSVEEQLPEDLRGLHALIHRSNNTQTSKGVCYDFDQIQLEDGESFPFKVKFTSTTVDVSGLEAEFGLGVPERVIKAYLASDLRRIDDFDNRPMPWDLKTLQRIYCYYALKLVESGRCGKLITRSKEEIHELIIDIENNPKGYSLFPKEEDKGESQFAIDLQFSARHVPSGERYDDLGITVQEDGSIVSGSDAKQANEIYEILCKPKKEYSQEFPLSKETLSFANALYACYILAYFIHNEKNFREDKLKIVPEELSQMGEIIKRKEALKTLDEFLEAFTKEAGFKDGAWVVDKMGPIELKLTIKEGVLITKEFDKKYGHGASERALKTYQAFPIEQRLDVNNDSQIPVPSAAALARARDEEKKE